MVEKKHFLKDWASIMTCDLTIEHNQREKVGKISSDLSLKQPETNSPIEQMRENLTDYDKNLHECIESGKKLYPGDFFVEIITKQEPLMHNVLRNYFVHRQSCPTPNYDQTLYKISPKNDQITFLWVIPSRGICHLLLENRLQVPPEEYELLDFVIQFARGDLFTLCKTLNGE